MKTYNSAKIVKKGSFELNSIIIIWNAGGSSDEKQETNLKLDLEFEKLEKQSYTKCFEHRRAVMIISVVLGLLSVTGIIFGSLELS